MNRIPLIVRHKGLGMVDNKQIYLGYITELSTANSSPNYAYSIGNPFGLTSKFSIDGTNLFNIANNYFIAGDTLEVYKADGQTKLGFEIKYETDSFTNDVMTDGSIISVWNKKYDMGFLAFVESGAPLYLNINLPFIMDGITNTIDDLLENMFKASLLTAYGTHGLQYPLYIPIVPMTDVDDTTKLKVLEPDADYTQWRYCCMWEGFYPSVNYSNIDPYTTAGGTTWGLDVIIATAIGEGYNHGLTTPYNYYEFIYNEPKERCPYLKLSDGTYFQLGVCLFTNNPTAEERRYKYQQGEPIREFTTFNGGLQIIEDLQNPDMPRVELGTTRGKLGASIRTNNDVINGRYVYNYLDNVPFKNSFISELPLNTPHQNSGTFAVASTGIDVNYIYNGDNIVENVSETQNDLSVYGYMPLRFRPIMDTAGSFYNYENNGGFLNYSNDNYYIYGQYAITNTTVTANEGTLKNLWLDILDITYDPIIVTDFPTHPEWSDVDGGYGTFEEDGDTTDLPALPNGLDYFEDTTPRSNNGSMATPWLIKNDATTDLYGSLDILSKYLNDPDLLASLEKRTAVIQGIISLKLMCLPQEFDSFATANIIKILGEDIQVEDGGTTKSFLGYHVEHFSRVSLGSVTIPTYFDSFLDRTPYTNIEIYLPFAGVHKLDTNLVVGKTISLYVTIDTFSGGILYTITDDEDNVLYEFEGNCSYEIPVFAQDYSGKYKQLIAGIGAMAIGIMGAYSMNPTAMLAGAGGALSVSSAIEMPPQVISSGNIKPESAFMSVKTPYIIITRPDMSLPENYQHTYGYPCNITRRLGDLEGMTKVASLHLDGIPASKSELDEIEALLRGGVVIKNGASE